MGVESPGFTRRPIGYRRNLLRLGAVMSTEVPLIKLPKLGDCLKAADVVAYVELLQGKQKIWERREVLRYENFAVVEVRLDQIEMLPLDLRNDLAEARLLSGPDDEEIKAECLAPIPESLKQAMRRQAEMYVHTTTPFPPIVLDGDMTLLDGWHRTAAARLRGNETILALVPAGRGVV